jgi:hypothetical protein
MKSSIKIASILLTAAALSLGILTEVKPAKSEPATLPNTQQQSPQTVPEPGTIMGLLLVVIGGLFVKKQIDETDTPELPHDSQVESTEINSEDNSEKN